MFDIGNVIFEDINIDKAILDNIDIDINKVTLKNIHLDVNIEKDIPRNIDIDIRGFWKIYILIRRFFM